MARTDDVINTAGHRLSTGQMEEIISTHSSVAECAVIGADDELKGETTGSGHGGQNGLSTLLIGNDSRSLDWK